MKICYLGAGVWGFCLASLLAKKGYQVVSWTIETDLVKTLQATKDHPRMPGNPAEGDISFTTDLAKALEGANMIVESVTSSGMRPVFEEVKKLRIPSCPIVLTSKGIEQNSGLILSEVVLDIVGENVRPQIGAISGPSYAAEVIKKLPTSVVGTAYDPNVMTNICQTFSTDYFRVYPNPDVKGVAYGGALKNIIAIACGIAEGLNLGNSAKAALMTRGLHEIRKLAITQGCESETLNGLSGMGDLFVTCSSLMSRNGRFGYLISQGKSPDEAKQEIGMVVEGAYTCVSALQLSKKQNVAMPITEMVYNILYEDMPPMDGVKKLMQREVKLETL